MSGTTTSKVRPLFWVPRIPDVQEIDKERRFIYMCIMWVPHLLHLRMPASRFWKANSQKFSKQTGAEVVLHECCLSTSIARHCARAEVRAARKPPCNSEAQNSPACEEMNGYLMLNCVTRFKNSRRSQHKRALYIQVSGYYKQLSNHYTDFVYIASIHNHIPFCLFQHPFHAHRRIQITGDFELSLQGGLQDYLSFNTFVW